MNFQNVITQQEYYNNILKDLVADKLGVASKEGFDADRFVAVNQVRRENNIPDGDWRKFVFPDGTEVPESEYGRDASVNKVLELTNTETYAEACEVLRKNYNGYALRGVAKELVKAGYPKAMADTMMSAFAGAGGLMFGMGMGDYPIPVDMA